MSYGLEIHNDDGDIVIDSVFQNHTKAEFGSSAGNVTLTFSGTYAFTRNPLFWMRSTAGYAGFVRWVLDGSSNVTGVVVACSGGAAFSWVLTAAPSGVGSDSYGLRVYTAAGDVCFDSGLNYIRIVDVLTFTGVAIKTHAAATNAFYCVSSGYQARAAQVSGSTSIVYTVGYKNLSTTSVGNFPTPVQTFLGVLNGGPQPSSVSLLVADI